MPVTVERPAPPADALTSLRERRQRRGSLRDRGRRIELGLVNNMPDGALLATQRQFTRLIEAGSPDLDVRIRLYTLVNAPRAPEAIEAMREAYRPSRALRWENFDGLIVTGCEPCAPSLPEEPYWTELTALFDQARARAHSALFSCLAAHAAVLHWDGVARRRLTRKISGVYYAGVVRRHPLVADLPEAILSPHSRLNDLDEAALAGKGYLTLTRSPEAGVDLFVKEGSSLLVFLQSHPEYDADSLAREYRRDIARYLNGRRETPPDPPEHYFAPAVLREVEAFGQRAMASRAPDLAAQFPQSALASDSEAPWREAAVRLYRNWLEIVADRKSALAQPRSVARWGG